MIPKTGLRLEGSFTLKITAPKTGKYRNALSDGNDRTNLKPTPLLPNLSHPASQGHQKPDFPEVAFGAGGGT